MSAVFSRRILLVAMGTTPHLLTMTLAALYKASPEAMPTEIHIVTTALGATKTRDACLVESPANILAAFYRDYQLTPARFTEDDIHTIPDEDGKALPDIRTEADSTRAADFITALIRTLTSDPNSSLHVSIVGGRKSMGMLLGSALTFYGRDQDRISHVFSIYETTPDRAPYPSLDDLSQDPDVVSLGEIPFLRLRPILPPVMLDAHYAFSEIVEASQQQIAQAPSVRVCRKKQKWALFAEGVELKVEQRKAAFFIWLLLRLKYGRETPTSFNGVELEHLFFLRLQFVKVSEHLLSYASWEKACAIYLGLTPKRLQKAEHALFNQGIESDRDYYRRFMATLSTDEQQAVLNAGRTFSSKLSSDRSKFNDAVTTSLTQNIPDVTNRRILNYCVNSNAQKDGCVYSLAVPADNVDLPAELLDLFQRRRTDAVDAWRNA